MGGGRGGAREGAAAGTADRAAGEAAGVSQRRSDEKELADGEKPRNRGRAGLWRRTRAAFGVDRQIRRGRSGAMHDQPPQSFWEDDAGAVGKPDVQTPGPPFPAVWGVS